MRRRSIGRAAGSLALGTLGVVGGRAAALPAAASAQVPPASGASGAQGVATAAPRLRDVRRFSGRRDALGLLDQPMDVAVDGRGVIYVADFDNHRIQRFGPDGRAMGVWGGEPGSAPGLFTSPMGVAVAPDGTVFVADTGNHRVKLLASDGTVVGMWQAAQMGLSERAEPAALCLAPDGTLVIADRVDGRLVRLSSSGAPLATWERSRSFDRPTGVAIGAAGDVFVTEPMRGAVRRIAPDGSERAPLRAAAYDEQLDRPAGLALDRMGNLYVADARDGAVFKYSSTGIALDRWGSLYGPGETGAGLGQFEGLRSPRGSTSDGASNVYVADAAEQRVFAFNAGGVLLRVWGAPPAGEPEATGALEVPVGVATDAQGNVYVTDPRRGRIVKLAPDGRGLAAWQLPPPTGSLSAPALPSIPWGVAVDAGGAIYVTELFGTRLSKLAPSGEIVATWSLAVPGQREQFRPSNLALDAAGNVYAIETYGTRVVKLSPAGERVATWGGNDGPLQGTVGIAVDAAGIVYVLDADREQVVRFGSDGRFLGGWRLPSPAAPFDDPPVGMALDGAGGLLIVTGGALGLVRRFSTEGRLLGAVQVGSGEDMGTTYLSGIAVDRAGRVFVTDRGTARVYSIA